MLTEHPIKFSFDTCHKVFLETEFAKNCFRRKRPATKASYSRSLGPNMPQATLLATTNRTTRVNSATVSSPTHSTRPYKRLLSPPNRLLPWPPLLPSSLGAKEQPPLGTSYHIWSTRTTIITCHTRGTRAT